MNYKTDSRIELRGRLDSLNAEIICAQTHSDNRTYIADLEEFREVIRVIQHCEAANESFAGRLTLWGLDEDEIHSLSHNPITPPGLPLSEAEKVPPAKSAEVKGKHIMPHYSMGVYAAEINRLRTLVRECELCAWQVFTDDELKIAHVLNRMSSALYVLTYKYLPDNYDKFLVLGKNAASR